MTTAPTSADRQLIEEASALLARAHDPALHRVAAAARGVSGAVYLGLSLFTPRESVCAESSAIANAKMVGEERIESIVSVGLGADDLARVVNPCGVCREVVPVFGRDVRVIVDVDGDVVVAEPRELLPMPWVRARSYG